MYGTSGTTDMALRYLERPVNKLVMLVENEWLRLYAWVRFHDREPFMNDWEVLICFNIPRGAMCRRNIGIETFTIVNSWPLPSGNFTCANLRTTHLFCTFGLFYFVGHLSSLNYILVSLVFFHMFIIFGLCLWLPAFFVFCFCTFCLHTLGQDICLGFFHSLSFFIGIYTSFLQWQTSI